MKKTNLKPVLLPQLFQTINPSVNQGFPDISQHSISNLLGELSWNKNVRYVHQQKQWYLWNKIYWIKDNKQENITRIRSFLDEIAKELDIWASNRKMSTDLKKDALLKKTSACIKSLRSKSFITEISNLTQSNRETAVNYDIFDVNPNVIGVPNGIIDLLTGKALPPTRHEYITKSTSVAPINKPATQWIKFLNKVFNKNKSIINFIQILLGYCLTGLTKEQKLFFFYGTGANGKSVLLEVLDFILRDYSKHAPSSLFIAQKMQAHPTELAGLAGSRCVIGSEIPSNQEWNESIIKDLTGGERISARLMRQDFFDFLPQFTLLIAGNHKPTINVQDYAIVRRMILIPFDVTIPASKRDKNLTSKLKSEAPEILNWMIEGAVKYYNQGLKIPLIIKNATDSYIQDQDLLLKFTDKYLKPSQFDKTLVSDLYNIFKSWAEGKAINYSEKEFRSILKSKGYKVTRSNSKYFLISFSLINESD